MQFNNSYEKLIPNITDENFISCALELFQYQAQHNFLYKEYLKNLNIVPSDVQSVDKIPFLPIEFFKSYKVKTAEWEVEKEFLSSGTTGQERSTHLIRDLSFYHDLSVRGFEQFYGSLENFVIVALLPSYQDQQNSSLISMVDHFISLTNNPKSGYVTVDDIKDRLKDICTTKNKVLLIGVSYALLDVCDINFECTRLIVMETGGMKGRKKEITRAELHRSLKSKFNVEHIHSEYGMTELLSQAYAKGNGVFQCPPWMGVMVRDLNDPFKILDEGQTGGLNIIDLANIHTCSFIETKDIGLKGSNNSFKVLGRFDNSDIRGCNLLMA